MVLYRTVGVDVHVMWDLYCCCSRVDADAERHLIVEDADVEYEERDERDEHGLDENGTSS